MCGDRQPLSAQRIIAGRRRGDDSVRGAGKESSALLKPVGVESRAGERKFKPNGHAGRRQPRIASPLDSMAAIVGSQRRRFARLVGRCLRYDLQAQFAVAGVGVDEQRYCRRHEKWFGQQSAG
jgi:hypothetical protein